MPTYTKLDHDTFEITEESTTQFSASTLLQNIAELQAQIDTLVVQLQGGAVQGVDDAVTALTTLASQPLSSTLANAQPLSAILDAALTAQAAQQLTP